MRSAPRSRSAGAGVGVMIAPRRIGSAARCVDLSAERRRERLRQLAAGIPPQVLAFLDAIAEAALDEVLRNQADGLAMKRKNAEAGRGECRTHEREDAARSTRA